MRRLAQLHRLRHFCLRADTWGRAKSLARLPPLPSLEVLQIQPCVRANGGLLAVFQKLPRLAELHLSAVDRAPDTEYDYSRFRWVAPRPPSLVTRTWSSQGTTSSHVSLTHRVYAKHELSS